MSRWAHWFAVDAEEAERLSFVATMRAAEDVERYLDPRLEEDDGPLTSASTGCGSRSTAA